MRTTSVIVGLCITLMTSSQLAFAAKHPCTGDELPLVSQDQVIHAVECELEGKVVKIEKTEEPVGYLKARVLLDDGRVKSVLVDSETGEIDKSNE